MQTRRRLHALPVWLLVGAALGIGYLQWQQLKELERMTATAESLEREFASLTAQDEPLRVDIAEVSVNAGLYSDVEGGFIQFSPVRIVDEAGEFDEFVSIPVTVAEPLEVQVQDEVDVFVTGGFVDVGN